MATIEDGYVYVTSGTVSQNTITGGSTVKIWVGGNVTENGANDIFFNAVPNTDVTQAEAKILNMGRFKESVTVAGQLRSRDRMKMEATTAIAQRDALRVLCKGTQPLKIAWGTYNATNTNRTYHADFNVNKWQFKFVPDTTFIVGGAHVVVGTDGNDYHCILDHTSDNDKKPIN